MKIIDLLNKIANGEEVPKKIKYNGEIFTLRDDKDDYANAEYWFTDLYTFSELNDEVEILEEEKKIPDEININLAYIDKEYLLEKEDVDRKINEIINRHNILVDKVSDYLKSKGE